LKERKNTLILGCKGNLFSWSWKVF